MKTSFLSLVFLTVLLTFQIDQATAQSATSRNKVVVIPLGSEPQSRTVEETIFIPSVAFTARNTANEVRKSFGNGGVFISGGSASFDGVVAPLALPNGAMVQRIEFFYRDNSAENLRLIFARERVTGGFDFIGDVNTSGISQAVQSVDLLSTPVTIDTSTGSYFLMAFNEEWPAQGVNLTVNGARVTYSLDR